MNFAVSIQYPPVNMIRCCFAEMSYVNGNEIYKMLSRLRKSYQKQFKEMKKQKIFWESNNRYYHRGQADSLLGVEITEKSIDPQAWIVRASAFQRLKTILLLLST